MVDIETWPPNPERQTGQAFCGPLLHPICLQMHRVSLSRPIQLDLTIISHDCAGGAALQRRF